MAILVQFPYDADKINKIKSIPSAKWDKARQGWLIPNAYREQTERLLTDAPPAMVERPAAWKFYTQPWAHQRAALEYAYAKPAVLLDMSMGTGKSKIVVDLLANRQHQQTLIVCPKSVVPVWEQQIARHSGEKHVVTLLDSGSVKTNLKRAQEAWRDARQYGWPWVAAVNYSAVWREPFADWALQQAWDCLVLDEIHHAKQAGGKASRFLYRLSFAAKQRVGLSGTVLAHSPMDAYGVFRCLDASIYGTNYTKFQERYAIRGGFNNYQVVGYQNQAEFQQKFDSIRFHVDRSVLDLPPVQHIDIPIALPDSARKVYRQLEKDFYAEVDAGSVTVANALVKILRLAQVTSGYLALDSDYDTPVLETLHSTKADALKDLVDGLDPQEPVVVFARFRYDLESICRAVTDAGRHYYELSGRFKQLDGWKADTSGAVLGVQIGAGAEGIDLTNARYCVFFSISLSLAQYDQALARVHRPGQANSVTYYHLIVPNSVDSKGYAALTARREVLEAILNGGQDV